MADNNIQIGGPLFPVPPPQSPKTGGAPVTGPQFREVFDRALQQGGTAELKLSAHARQRLEQRNINLSDADMARLNKAANLAASKGSRDSLMLMDGLGMIVNIPNRTVVTAVVTSELRDQVFTNIDSAVIVD